MPKQGQTSPPTELEFEKALMYFHAYMYGPLQGKLRLYKARNIHTAGGTTMSADWEVFASILLDDLGKKLSAGVDLSHYEVKSAKQQASYEYQYHKNSGMDKLKHDMIVGHLFFEYGENLRLVHLRYVHGSQLQNFFQKWLDEWPEPYPQRYRKSIPYKWVEENGVLLMTLRDGELTYPAPPSES
jgi:hypothetical protein